MVDDHTPKISKYQTTSTGKGSRMASSAVDGSHIFIRESKGGTILYVAFRDGSRRVRRSLETKNLKVAESRVREVIYGYFGLNQALLRTERKRQTQAARRRPNSVSDDWAEQIELGTKTSQSWLSGMHRRALDRSRRRNIQMELTLAQLIDIAKKSQGVCELTGIPFDWEKDPSVMVAPYAPCLDRIDSQKGYLKSNVRLVCNCVNTAMGQWGEGVLLKIAHYLNGK